MLLKSIVVGVFYVFMFTLELHTCILCRPTLHDGTAELFLQQQVER